MSLEKASLPTRDTMAHLSLRVKVTMTTLDMLETSQERKEKLKAEGPVALANSTSLEEET